MKTTQAYNETRVENSIQVKKICHIFQAFPPFLVDNTVRRMSLFLKVSIRATGNSCSKLIHKKSVQISKNVAAPSKGAHTLPGA